MPDVGRAADCESRRALGLPVIHPGPHQRRATVGTLAVAIDTGARHEPTSRRARAPLVGLPPVFHVKLDRPTDRRLVGGGERPDGPDIRLTDDPRGTPQSSRKGTAVHRAEAAIVTKIATRASLCATR